MRTPADPQRVYDLAYTGDPVDAVVRAWTHPGPNPRHHEAARREIRKTVPVLAAALDRLANPEHQEPRACTCGAKFDRCPDCTADDAYEKGRKDAACDLDHADEWVEVDETFLADLVHGLGDVKAALDRLANPEPG